ncbi:MAG: discoidin domain-containing protein [Hyphomicrobiales bacterium]
MNNYYPRLLMVVVLALCFTKAKSQNNVEVYSVCKDSPTYQKLSEAHFNGMSNQALYPNLIRIYSGEQKQELMGIGGAMTESAVSVIRTLPEEKQKEIFDAYYSKDGAQYSLMRTHIGSCDFSTRYYSYDNTPNDWDLKDFSFKDEERYVLPAVKQALAINPEIKIFAAPWSPPAWMKKSGEMYGGGTGSFSLRDNSLREDCYDVYARYLARYVQEYKKRGINIYSVSLQNETQNNSKWEACTYSIDQSLNFIGDHLGPVFKANGIDSKIIIWDWDKQVAIGRGDGMKKYCNALLGRGSKAAQYIYGVGFHWYAFDLGMHNAGEEAWSINDFGSIDYVKDRFPQTHMIATEGCKGGTFIRQWKPAARYIFDIINDLSHHTEGWIDWNIVLNQHGNPCHDGIPNCGHAPIMVNTDTKEIIYNPSYYVMKLFSRNVRPGGHVINSTFNEFSDNNISYINQVAIQNPDGTISVIVANNLDEVYNIEIADGNNSFKYQLPPNSITVFKYKKTSYNRNDLVDAKMAICSNTEHGYNPSHATDLNPDSRWASDWTDDQWLTIYMDESQTVNSVSSLWENGSSDEYDIMYLDSDNTWKNVDYLNRYSTSSMLNINGPYPFYKHDFDIKSNQVNSRKVPMRVDFFKPVKTQAISIHGHKRNEKYGYSIYEVKVSGPSNPNLLYRSNLSAYASGIEYDHYPSLVLNKDPNTRWASDWDDNQSITFDAGERCHFSTMCLKFENSRNCKFEIQVSDDNKSFHSVPYNMSRFWEYTKASLDSTRAVGRYIRFQGIRKNGMYGYSIINASISGHYDNVNKSFTYKTSSYQKDLQDDTTFNIYPNPVSNFDIMITAKNNYGLGYIYNVNGDKLQRLDIHKGENKFHLNLNPGTYFFKLKDSKPDEVRKIIIE